MAALPENWEWDYDGNRWFYRYKPTGLIQYTFPKPGDEFPEFVDDLAAPLDLAPEEKLVSQLQVKRRSTLGDSSSSRSGKNKTRERASSNAVSDSDDGGGPFWLQPDGLMYMGPGAYNDISPLQEEEEEERCPMRGSPGEIRDATAQATAHTDAATSAANAAAAAAEEVPRGGLEQPVRWQVSPLQSTQTTPLPASSRPATATPGPDGAVIVGSSENVSSQEPVVPPTDVPFHDSRQVPYNPLGVVAELASESTAKCEEEINPAPVELPGCDMTFDTPAPASYANAFALAPVELPSDEVPAGRAANKAAAEQKSLAVAQPGKDQEEQQQAYKAVQQLLNRPYRAIRQNSLPLSPATLPDAVALPAEPACGKYQPYNPSRPAVHGVAARTSHLSGENKRHSLAGPAPSHFQPPNAPPSFQPSAVPRKLPFHSTSGELSTTANAGARPASISGLVRNGASGGLTHVPSVLQPARGRPIIRAQSPPQSQGASPARAYQTYKPYRDLQQDIEETVQLLSKTGYGQGTAPPAETPGSGRPQVSRTSTLPTNLPTIPYMGARPQLPASAASDPVTLQNLQSHQASSGESTGGIALGGSTVPRAYFAPLPPSSSDMPQPLNIPRKSPSPQNNMPTTASSFRPPVAGLPAMVPHEDTPGASGAVIASGPIIIDASHPDGLSGRTETASEPRLRAAPTMPVNLPSENQGTGQCVKSVGQPQLASQVAVSAGFSVMSEPPIPPAPAPPHSVTVEPHTGTAPTPAASFSVEATATLPLAIVQDQKILPGGANAPVSGDRPLVSEAQGAGPDPTPEPSTSQMTNPVAPLHFGLGSSGEAQGPLPVVSDAMKSSASLSTTSEHQTPPSDPPNQAVVGQAATPPPSHPQSVRTPSPPSRVSSPETQRGNAIHDMPPAPAPASTVISPGQDPGPAAQPLYSASPPMDATGATSSTEPGAAPLLPSQRPLASDQAAVSQPALAVTSVSTTSPEQRNIALGVHSTVHAIALDQAGLPSHQPPQTAPGPQLPQPSSQNPNTVPSPPVSGPPAFVGQQAAVPYSPSAADQRHATGPPRTPPAAAGQSQPAATPPVPGQPPQQLPLEQSSKQASPQATPPARTQALGTAPSQMAAVSVQPAMHPGVPPQGFQQHGMLPQQPYPFAPGMFPQAGMQHRPTPPHMMQPSQMHGGQYVMPPLQPAPPVKEEKSWFGKLWRSESVRKLNPSKLQKTARPLAPQHPPQQFLPSQPVPHPQFAPPGAQIPPGTMMQAAQQTSQAPNMQQPQHQGMPQQQGGPQSQPQPQQPPPQTQQQTQQHHQQQPLTWHTVNTNGGGSEPLVQPPQFRAPNHNPNQPVMPPPHVRQEIHQQVLRLDGQQGQGQGQAHQGQGHGPAKPLPRVQAQSQTDGSQDVNGKGNAAGSNAQAERPADQGRGTTTATAAAYDGSAYDGADWGGDYDDEDDGGVGDRGSGRYYR